MAKRYRIPNLTVDGVIVIDGKIVLVKRRRPPFEGKLALPGGFVEYGETVEEAVRREVKEETGLSTRIIRLLGVYSDPARDPRGHTVSIAFVLKAASRKLRSGSDAASVELVDLAAVPELAFDHSSMVRDYRKSEAVLGAVWGKKHN
ncbi:MAG: NUDIX hydrolase [Methanomassiliicoccales archaeon]|jgi:8-oxo-dGTP diphosphatase